MPNIDLTNNGLGNTNVPGGGGNPSGMPGMMNQSGVKWEDLLKNHMPTQQGTWSGQGEGMGGGSTFIPTSGHNFSYPTYGGGGQGGNYNNFPANGINNSQVPYMSSLNPGGGIGQYNLGKGTSEQLHDIYGSFGNVLYNYLSGGAGYNPQVAGALINQMQPLEARGRNHVLDAFGDEGQRFSSTSAIGLGDFESQFAADEAGVLAQEYDKAQSRYASLLGDLMGDTRDQHAASGTDWGSIIGAGFDIASMFI
jgi:hypothetical protein